jgi:hypothetical protein
MAITNAATLEAQEAQIIALAKLAGLDLAVQDYRQDVMTAARTALNVQKSFSGPALNTTEPWPAMKVKA